MLHAVQDSVEQLVIGVAIYAVDVVVAQLKLHLLRQGV